MKNRIDRILVLPNSGDNFENQLTNCIEQLINHRLGAHDSVLQISFFINANSNATFLQNREIIRNQLKNSFNLMPSISVINQPPAQGHEVTLEIILIKNLSEDLKLIHKEEQGINYTVLEGNQSYEIYVGGISAYKPNSPFVEQVERSYQIMEAILHREGMDFSDIVRQWNYVENILEIKDKDEEHMQNYQVLNDVRSIYYSKCDFKNSYPAATGIGMNFGGLVLEMYAVKQKDNVEIYPIKNPMQTDAYHYSDEVLVGDALQKKMQKTTPKFERAKYISINGTGTVYISGTASIQNEKTIGIGDTQKQTQITLENIASLIAKENLLNVGVSSNGCEMNYTFIRAYIKNPKDYTGIKEACDLYYGTIPLHYLIADVCRDNLLVELEGVAESCN